MEENIFSLFAPNQSAMDEAKEHIEKFLAAPREPELEFGAIYTAKIVELRDIGVMVTLYPGMNPTLLHNSQLDQRKVSVHSTHQLANYIVQGADKGCTCISNEVTQRVKVQHLLITNSLAPSRPLLITTTV